MWVKAREVFFIIVISIRRPRERGDPYSVSVMVCTVRVTFARGWHWRLEFGPGVMGPRVRGDDDEDTSSRQRETQSLAAARHVDGGKAAYGEATGAAIALLVDLELAFAGAKLGGAAPVQWSVLDLEGAVFGVDRLGERGNLLRCAGDIRMQAFAGLDAIPAAADHGLAVVGGNRGHDLVRRVVAPGQTGGGRRLHRVDHHREEIRRLHDIG